MEAATSYEPGTKVQLTDFYWDAIAEVRNRLAGDSYEVTLVAQTRTPGAPWPLGTRLWVTPEHIAGRAPVEIELKVTVAIAAGLDVDDVRDQVIEALNSGEVNYVPGVERVDVVPAP